MLSFKRGNQYNAGVPWLLFFMQFFPPNFESFALFPRNSAVKKIVSHGLRHSVLPKLSSVFAFWLFQSTKCHIFSIIYLVIDEILTLKVPITTAAENNFTFIYYFIYLFLFYFIFSENKVLAFQMSHLSNRWFTQNVRTYFSQDK